MDGHIQNKLIMALYGLILSMCLFAFTLEGQTSVPEKNVVSDYQSENPQKQKASGFTHLDSRPSSILHLHLMSGAVMC
ncbi:MAG: hypothetical protein MJZ16_06325 [Bacteroidales bacterium]|nr:hypothetical protein [Bacteroidales bacterium]